MRAWIRRSALTAVALFALGCIRPAVREQVAIRFAADAVEVQILTRFESELDGPAARRAVDEYRGRVEAGDDPWQEVLAAIGPERSRTVLDRVASRVVRIERHLWLDGPDRLEALFGRDAVHASVDRADGSTSLILTPVGSLADGAERARFEQRWQPLVRSFRRYLEATTALYRWAQTTPSRRSTALGVAFEELLDAPGQRAVDTAREALDAQDRGTIEEFDQAQDELADLLFEADGDRVNLATLARRVWHPLVADLTVTISGTVTRVEGFEQIDAQQFAIPERSLVSALESAARGIVEPLPLAVVVKEMLGSDDSPEWSLTTVEKTELTAGPVPADLEALVVAGLQPAGGYVVEWRDGGR